MIEEIEFEDKINGGSEIHLLHSTGETTILLFRGKYPLMVKEYYIESINRLLEMHPDISPNEELSGIFSWWFLRCSLESPMAVATFRNDERRRIGKRIREIREEKGIEAKQLSILSGIAPANISRIEQGKHSVGIDVLSKLVNALGYKIEIVKT